ncbi:heme-binding protein soul4 [Latimeria chalumnae]|uniref:Heme-binding protein soul4 n=1 Tax=Latimeria chalumnae TaxID=7897 RepID=H3AXC9_LATCH|nr:PREDICTED: heme-binding protein 1-like [Latimeria chalumnae]|eukprot:XP_005996727.1 PREDICTED: heme-binding protein 1-like [Latimeria chalumnae]
MAQITLEDLDMLDDVTDDVSEENVESEDREEEERLFSHWETVAGTHHVHLPQEMARPIVQMTRQNQQQEQVPYVVLSRHYKCDEVAYEERLYSPKKWACITKGESLYEQSISMGFMKLMRYICGQNSTGQYLGMTVPILNEVQLAEDGNSFSRDVVTAYYLPAERQDQPPQPQDPDITIVERNAIRVVSRIFYGTTTEETILREIGLLWELLGSPDDFIRHTFIVAVYENPGIPNRRNELWFIRRPE